MNDELIYKKKFDIESEYSEKTKLALDYALDIRKFEIELYWKRAAYFWALIAVAFAGFFAVLGSKDIPEREFYAFIIGVIGFVFSWSWFLVNKGSKFWQENWENHVNMLEDAVIGPLYKTTLHRPKDCDLFELLITGPARLSVSKVNQWVSFFTIIIWCCLIWSITPDFSINSPISYSRIIIIFITVTICLLMCFKGKSHVSEQRHIMRSIKSRIL